MRCFCTPRFSSSLQKRTFRQQGRLSRFRDALLLIPWGWAETRAYGCVVMVWFYGCACASRAYGYFMVYGLCGDDASSSQKNISCGVRFFICKGMKNCRITQVFLQVFLGFFYCFFHCFSNLFSRCFSSPFSICSYVSPLLQKWPLRPSVTPLREISQAFPCRTLLRSCPLSRTGDRS